MQHALDALATSYGLLRLCLRGEGGTGRVWVAAPVALAVACCRVVYAPARRSSTPRIRQAWWTRCPVVVAAMRRISARTWLTTSPRRLTRPPGWAPLRPRAGDRRPTPPDGDDTLPRPADRVATLKPSATVEMTERVRAARAAGRRIIGLSSGDPNIPTDPRIVAAAERALRDGDTHYGPAAGLPALREALAEREGLRTGARYAAADVLVTPGGKFALLTALMGTVQPGDEVLVPEPGWVSYGPCVRLCGGVPVALPMLDRIDGAALEDAVTPRTVAVVLNSPVNPTARTLSRAELDAVLDVAERHDLWVVFDQVYSDLLHTRGTGGDDGGSAFAAPQATPAGQARTLVVDSMSKTFGMTGWRLGSLAVPAGMARLFQRFMQHSVYCVPGFVQQAGVQALALFDELLPGYRALFRARQEYAAGRLSALPGMGCGLPDAGFYLFPSVPGDDAAVSARWLDQLGVATVPGSAFGAAGAGHVRLSLTAPDAELAEAMDRIAALVQTGMQPPGGKAP